METDDLFPRSVLSFVAWVIGARMANGRPRVTRWGQGLALGAFGLVVADSALDPGAGGDALVGAVISGLVTAWLTLGLSWVALAGLAFAYDHLVLAPLLGWKRWSSARRSRRAERRSLREEEQRRRRAQTEHERRAPEREQIRLQAEAEQQAREESQRRRIDARASALLSFSLFAPKLGDRFTELMFERYVKDFMGDDFTTVVVERRGRELLSILELHLKDIQPPKRETDFESIAEWHRRELERIDALPLEAAVKNYCRVGLNRRMQDLLAQHLRDANP